MIASVDGALKINACTQVQWLITIAWHSHSHKIIDAFAADMHDLSEWA